MMLRALKEWGNGLAHTIYAHLLKPKVDCAIHDSIAGMVSCCCLEY